MRMNSRGWRRRLIPKRREVVLLAQIEYNQVGDQQGMRIGGDRKNNDFQLPELRQEVKTVIEQRLPSDLEELFGIQAEIRVRAFLIASYKDFFDSINLIKDHCSLLLRELLRDRYSHSSFNVNVFTKHPHLPDPYGESMDMPRRYLKKFGPELVEMLRALGAPPAPPHRARRDGFFWFLLVLCALLLAALGLLVYAAVVKTYFP
jgi:hypothetical protein